MQPRLTQPPQHLNPGPHTAAVPCMQGAKDVPARPTRSRALKYWGPDAAHQTAQSNLLLVVPLQLHAKLVKVKTHLGTAIVCPYEREICVVGCSTGPETAHLRSATARPRRCLPCAARCFQSPRVRVDALPCSLAAIWPIRAEHSRCRLCSAPAVPRRVRHHALTRTIEDSILSDTRWKGATEACPAPAQHQVCSQH